MATTLPRSRGPSASRTRRYGSASVPRKARQSSADPTTGLNSSGLSSSVNMKRDDPSTVQHLLLIDRWRKRQQAAAKRHAEKEKLYQRERRDIENRRKQLEKEKERLERLGADLERSTRARVRETVSTVYAAGLPNRMSHSSFSLNKIAGNDTTERKSQRHSHTTTSKHTPVAPIMPRTQSDGALDDQLDKLTRPHPKPVNVAHAASTKSASSKSSTAKQASRPSSGKKEECPQSDAPETENMQRFEYWQGFWSKVQQLKTRLNQPKPQSTEFTSLANQVMFGRKNRAGTTSKSKSTFVPPLHDVKHREEAVKRDVKATLPATTTAAAASSGVKAKLHTESKANTKPKANAKSKSKPQTKTTSSTHPQTSASSQNSKGTQPTSKPEPGMSKTNFQNFLQGEQSRRRQRFMFQKRRMRQFVAPDSKESAIDLIKRFQKDLHAKMDAKKQESSQASSPAPAPATESAGTSQTTTPPKSKSTAKPKPAAAAPPKAPSASDANPASTESPPSPSHSHTSTASSGSNVSSSRPSGSLRVLKNRAKQLGISLHGVVERMDLEKLVAEAEAEVARKKAAAKEERRRERVESRIQTEVEAWSRGKGLVRMLNDVNTAKFGDDLYLTRNSSLKVIKRTYRKALLKIHPDKHVNDWQAHIRATEMFKAVNSAYTSFNAKPKQPTYAGSHRRR
jgi:DnaJ domain